ncbi:MAG: tetratricopeptide repeat protein, partial [Halobacteriota archaeon]|nr:tetratricopeptide repeat protein [Halobacteriota archaeon]
MGLFDRNKKIEGKTAEEWYDLGENEKDLIKEVEYYLKCVELDPKNAIAWYNIGLGFYILQRYEEAIRCCDKALEIDPEDANALYIKGLTLYNLGRNEEAIRCCDKALEIDPSYINAKKGKKTVEEKLKGKNSSKKPVASIKKTIRKPSPSSKSTTQDTIGGKTASEWENEGETLRKSGIYEETIRWFDKVLEIDPGDDDAWTQKGLALRNLEQYDEAIRWFDKVLEIDPGDDDAWTQKGLALRNLEQYDEAIRCYD